MIQKTYPNLSDSNRTLQVDFGSLKPIFSAIQPFTTLDDEGKLGAVFFTGGCQFRCLYCHNPQFVLPEKLTFLPVEKFTSFLKKRVGILESITICGGEPTVHNNMIEWLRLIKSHGYRIKFDTNGMRPKEIESYINEGLIDFFAVDYKAPIDYYYTITQKNNDVKSILETIKLIVKSEVQLELRSTLHPDLHSHRMILKMIDEVHSLGVKSYYLQHYKHVACTIGDLKEPSIKLDLNQYLPLLELYFEKFGIRN